MAQGSNSGLAQRGLLLFGLLTAVLVVVWAIFLRTPSQQLPSEVRKPDLPAGLVYATAANFPASVPWVGVARMSELMPSARGWEIRYQATVALARRGDPQLPFDNLNEMLDEDRQMRNFRVRLQDGREVPDEGNARRTVLEGLKSLSAWTKHPEALKAVGTNNPGLQMAYAAIEKLTHSPNLVVKTEATNVQRTLPKS